MTSTEEEENTKSIKVRNEQEPLRMRSTVPRRKQWDEVEIKKAFMESKNTTVKLKSTVEAVRNKMDSSETLIAHVVDYKWKCLKFRVEGW